MIEMHDLKIVVRRVDLKVGKLDPYDIHMDIFLDGEQIGTYVVPNTRQGLTIPLAIERENRSEGASEHEA